MYIDVKIESEQTKRIEIGLFGKTVPLTVNNFVALAKGHTSDDGQVFGYTGTTFDVIIKDAFIEGGDVTHGKGSYSIYGPQFKDENFELQGYGAGWVMMANFGSDTNASNFVIILRPVPWWLVNKYVVFGKVIKGMVSS